MNKISTESQEGKVSQMFNQNIQVQTKSKSIDIYELEELAKIDIKLIICNPHNPRDEKEYEKKSFNDDVKSNQEENITLALNPDPNTNKEFPYMVVSGHRRFMALKEAGHEFIRAVIRSDLKTQKQIDRATYIANKKRSAMQAYEEAKFFQHLIDDHKMTMDGIIDDLDLSTTYVSRRLAIFEFPKSVIELIRNGSLKKDHAFGLINYNKDENNTDEDVIQLVNQIIDEKWSRQALRDFLNEKSMSPEMIEFVEKISSEFKIDQNQCRITKNKNDEITLEIKLNNVNELGTFFDS